MLRSVGFWACLIAIHVGVLMHTTAFAQAPASCPTLPVLSFGTHDLVQPSLFGIEHVSHSFEVEVDRVRVSSEFLLFTDGLRTLPCSLAIGVIDTSVQDIVVEVGNMVVPLSPLPDHPELGMVSLEGSRSLDTLRLRLTYSKLIKTGEFFKLTASGLLAPTRVVAQNGRLGLDPRTPISFADKVWTDASIVAPDSLFVVGSGTVSQDGNHRVIPPVFVGEFTVVFAPNKNWILNTFENSGTTFEYLYRSTDSTIDVDDVKNSVAFAWPRFVSNFGRATEHAVFIEADGPLGGGALGSNVLALYSTPLIPEALQAYIEAVSGAPRLPSTRAYADYLFSSSTNPLHDYIATIAIHELGHLYFGFGQLCERYPETYQVWFSLGLGIVFDNQITKAFIGQDPALFKVMEARWKEKFDTLLGVDQRLQFPNLAADQNFGVQPFHRVQLYAHSKAAFVLRTMRDKVGPDKFDALVLEYLKKGGGSRGDGYVTFREHLKIAYPELEELEKELVVL